MAFGYKHALGQSADEAAFVLGAMSPARVYKVGAGNLIFASLSDKLPVALSTGRLAVWRLIIVTVLALLSLFPCLVAWLCHRALPRRPTPSHKYLMSAFLVNFLRPHCAPLSTL